MKIIFTILGILALLVILLAPTSDFLIIGYFVIAPLCALIGSSIISYIIWWFRPKDFCKDWDYMSDKERKAYLKEQKEKRNHMRARLGMKLE